MATGAIRNEKGRFVKGHPGMPGSGAPKGGYPANGFTKGMVPWNKGARKPKQLTLRLKRPRPKGTHNSPATEFKRGTPSPMKGIPTGRTPANKCGETRHCQNCHRAFHCPNWEIRDNRRFCSRECAYKGRKIKGTFGKGKDHPAWRHGLSLNEYPSKFNRRLKRRIRERDGYRCQLCNISEEEHLKKVGRVLVVNHIDFDKQNCDERNLNTLCIGCNTRISWGDRQHWTLLFQKQMEERLGK